MITVDEGDDKCAGIAVWSGPVKGGKVGLRNRLRNWWFICCVDVWLLFNMIYYRGAGMDGKVFLFLG